MSKSKADRSAQLTIRLDPKIIDGLRLIADRVGIAATTVAGMAIGEYVSKNLATFESQASMSRLMAEEMAKVIGGPMAAIFEGKTPEELKEIFKDD